MPQKSNIHFEISERKVLLRIFDIVSVLAVLYAVGIVFDFDYFKINADHWVWSIVLALYLSIFATIFELYNLQKASKFEIVVQNIILTVSVTVLFYLSNSVFYPGTAGKPFADHLLLHCDEPGIICMEVCLYRFDLGSAVL